MAVCGIISGLRCGQAGLLTNTTALQSTNMAAAVTVPAPGVGWAAVTAFVTTVSGAGVTALSTLSPSCANTLYFSQAPIDAAVPSRGVNVTLTFHYSGVAAPLALHVDDTRTALTAQVAFAFVPLLTTVSSPSTVLYRSTPRLAPFSDFSQPLVLPFGTTWRVLLVVDCLPVASSSLTVFGSVSGSGYFNGISAGGSYR